MRALVMGMVAVALVTGACAPGPAHPARQRGDGSAGSVQAATSPIARARHVTSHRRHALEVADRLLARLPVPPGTHLVPSGSRYGLGGAPYQPASDHLIDQGRVWVGGASESALEKYFARHLPDGLRRSGTATYTRSSPSSTSSVDVVTYDLDQRWQDGNAYSGMQLLLSYPEHSSAVAVRADVQAIYLPDRTAGQQLPRSVTGVEFTIVTTAYQATVTTRTAHRVADAATARRLVADLNALSPLVPTVHSCPAARHTTSITLRFTGPGAGSAVENRNGCVDSVTIAHGPLLAISARLTTDLTTALR